MSSQNTIIRRSQRNWAGITIALGATVFALSSLFNSPAKPKTADVCISFSVIGGKPVQLEGGKPSACVLK